VLEGLNFFREFSPLHLLWLLWMVTMIHALFPTRDLALGAQKLFKRYFMAVNDKEKRHELMDDLYRYISINNYAAIKIAIVWVAFNLVLGGLYLGGVYDSGVMLIFSAAFYVCDLICVLFWCPFRVFFMKNRCCTTCRIFNWGHIMMFSPMAFVMGFYCWSLFLMAVALLIVWEVCVLLHPERFWEQTNVSLKCKNCEDVICGKHPCHTIEDKHCPMNS